MAIWPGQASSAQLAWLSWHVLHVFGSFAYVNTCSFGPFLAGWPIWPGWAH